jgi:hypothetical protein
MFQTINPIDNRHAFQIEHARHTRKQKPMSQSGAHNNLARRAKAVLIPALALTAFVSLTGCHKKESFGVAATAPTAAMMAAPGAAPAPGQAPERGATLAYEHEVSIELDRKLLPTRLREIESACAAGKPEGCTVLEVSLRTQEGYFTGTIRMRLAPSGVNPTIEQASQGGKLFSRSTRAEDLAQPIADTQRRLALMTTHRDRLAEIMKNKDLKVDQLITISKELATVQTQIDALSTDQATLRRRVDTHLLTLHLSPSEADYQARHTPISDSVRFFGRNFREAVADVIHFIAVLLPWTIVLLPGLFLLRAFWSWIGRTLARRQQRREGLA